MTADRYDSEYLNTPELVELGAANVGASLKRRLGSDILWLELCTVQNVKHDDHDGTDAFMAVYVKMAHAVTNRVSEGYLRFDDKESWGLSGDQLRLLGACALRRPVNYALPQGIYIVPSADASESILVAA